jgi:hypothetical protein
VATPRRTVNHASLSKDIAMQRRYTVFMLLKATPQWQGLSAQERHAVLDETLTFVFEAFPEVRLRYYDSEAFHGRCAGVAAWETSDLQAYYELVAALRDTDFLARHFEVADAIIGAEDSWRELERPMLSAAAV